MNGSVFESIVTIDAVAGQDRYRFTDAGVPGGVITYRIRAVWLDGSVSFSAIVSVMEAQAGVIASLRPSVISQGTVNLYIAVPKAMTVNLLVVDAAGKVLARRAANLAAGSQTITLDGLPGRRGLYYVRLSGGDGFLQTLVFEKNVNSFISPATGYRMHRRRHRCHCPAAGTAAFCRRAGRSGLTRGWRPKLRVSDETFWCCHHHK